MVFWDKSTFLSHHVILNFFYKHYCLQLRNSRTYSLCSITKSYAQCPLLVVVLFLYEKKRLWQFSKRRSNIWTGHHPQDVGSTRMMLNQHKGDRQHVEAANAGAIAQNVSGNAQIGGNYAQFGGTRCNYRKWNLKYCKFWVSLGNW